MEVVRGEQERWGTTTGPKAEQGPHLGTRWGRKGRPSLERDEAATDNIRGAPHSKVCFFQCKKIMSWETYARTPWGFFPEESIGKEWGPGINPQQPPHLPSMYAGKLFGHTWSWCCLWAALSISVWNSWWCLLSPPWEVKEKREKALLWICSASGHCSWHSTAQHEAQLSLLYHRKAPQLLPITGPRS